MENNHNDLLHRTLTIIVQYGLVISVFIFSILAKVRTLFKYRRGMSKKECVMETILTGIGSAIVIWVLHKMNLPEWIFCSLGGASGLLITPIANSITKNAPEVLDTIWEKLTEYIKKKW